jgi:rare lipoprotein A
MQQFVRHRRSYRVAYVLSVAVACAALAGCVTDDTVAKRTSPDADVAAAPAPQRSAKAATAKRHAQAAAREDAAGYSAVGLASWYGAGFHGRRTADGETFDMHSLTAAHRTLPLQCTVRVTNLANHRSLLVRVNDRGPFVGNRLIDLSAQSAKVLGFYDRGVARVKVDYVAPASRPAAPRVTAAAAPL